MPGSSGLAEVSGPQISQTDADFPLRLCGAIPWRTEARLRPNWGTLPCVKIYIRRPRISGFRGFRGRGPRGRGRETAAVGEAWGIVAPLAQGRCAHWRMHAPRAGGKSWWRFGAGWRRLLDLGGICTGRSWAAPCWRPPLTRTGAVRYPMAVFDRGPLRTWPAWRCRPGRGLNARRAPESQARSVRHGLYRVLAR